MVDPNRKINRLTEKDIEFLDECEEEFGNRYTDEDVDFMAHCVKADSEPPIVQNWSHSGGGGGHGYGHSQAGNSGNIDGGRGRQRNHYGGGHRNNRGWNRRGGSNRGYRNNFRYKQYDSERSDDYGSGQRRHDDHNEHTNHGGRNNDRERPPMNIPKGYGNFVAASRE